MMGLMILFDRVHAERKMSYSNFHHQSLDLLWKMEGKSERERLACKQLVMKTDESQLSTFMRLGNLDRAVNCMVLVSRADELCSHKAAICEKHLGIPQNNHSPVINLGLDLE